jgi:hypothetical protein
VDWLQLVHCYHDVGEPVQYQGHHPIVIDVFRALYLRIINMKFGTITGLSALAVGLLAASASANTVSLGVFSTGNNGATLLTAGTADSSYLITSQPAGTNGNTLPYSPIVTDNNPTGWLPDSTSFSQTASKWVAPQEGGSHSDPAGVYDYTTSFDLTSNDILSTGNLIFTASADNDFQVFFNGTLIGGSTGNTAYTQFWGPFTITSGFQDGMNTLLFVVTNAAGTATPTGLNVSVSNDTIDTVPEPSAVASFSIAGLMLGGLLLRGRRNAAPKAAI